MSAMRQTVKDSDRYRDFTHPCCPDYPLYEKQCPTFRTFIALIESNRFSDS